jgi:hypothetical protein
LYSENNIIFVDSDSTVNLNSKAIIADSQNIKLIYLYNQNTDRVLDVKLMDTFALVCDYYNGVHLFSVSNPELPRLLGTCDTPGTAIRMSLHEDLVNVADGLGGISVLTFRDPENPELYCTYPSYNGGTTYGIYTLNPSDENKALPIDIDSTETLHKQPFIFAAGGRDGLLIFNITNFNPMLMSQYYVPEGIPGIWVDKDVAYVLTYNYLTILDVSNKNKPVFIKQFYITDANHDLYLYEDYLYVCAGHGDMLIYDVKDRKNPIQVGMFDAAGPSIDVYVTGNRVFLASNEGGISVLDVTDKSHPKEIAYYRSPGFETRGIFAVGDYIYVGAQYAGFFVFKYSEPATEPIKRNAEEKMNNYSKINNSNFSNICFENDMSENGILSIYDLDGRFIYKNQNIELQRGFNTIKINKQTLKQGTYFWTIEKESGKVSGKLIIFGK